MLESVPTPKKRGRPQSNTRPSVKRYGPFTIHTSTTGHISYRLRIVVTFSERDIDLVEAIYGLWATADEMRGKGVLVDFAPLFLDFLRKLSAGSTLRHFSRTVNVADETSEENAPPEITFGDGFGEDL